MNVNKVLTKDYENKPNWTLGENEPKTNPNEPNFKGKKCFSAIDGKEDFGYCTGAILGLAYCMLHIEAEK